MRKLSWLSYVLAVILLTSCSVLTGGGNQPENQVATSVQETLTAIPISTTQAPVPTTTPNILPTITETTTATSAVTETPTPSPTMAFTETPTLSEDPRDSLGTPTWVNTLDNGSAFGLDAGGYQDENSKIVVAGGAMVLSSYSNIGYHGWRLASPTPKNFYLEATFITQTCAGTDEYGIVFRAPDYSSGKGYYYGLRCNGEYNLSRWDEFGLTPMMSWTSSPNVLAGPGQTNRMGVLANGSSLKLYVNGKFLTELTDSKFSEGHFGAYVSGYSSTMTVNMDLIQYWNLP